jgi:hypothetical protein
MTTVGTTLKWSGALAFSGAATGWLAGLSVSPTVAAIIASILAFVSSSLTVLYGIQETSHEKEKQPYISINVHGSLPIVFSTFVVMLAVGATAGVYARTHNWLGLALSDALSTWSGEGKLPAQQVTSRLFDIAYPSPSEPESEASEPTKEKKSDKNGGPAARVSSAGPVLFGVDVQTCERLSSTLPDQLRPNMIASGAPFRAIASRVDDAAVLKGIVEDLCKKG